MTNIVNAITLDFHVLGAYKKSYIIMLILPLFFMVAFQDATLAIYMAIFMSVFIIGYPFSIGENHNIPRLMSTLPLNRNQTVAARYLSVILIVLLFNLIIIAEGLITSLFLPAANNLLAQMPLFILGFAFILFCAAFQLPIYYKFGYMRARWAAFAPVAVICLVLVIIGNIYDNSNYALSGVTRLITAIAENFTVIATVTLGACLAIYILSFFVARAIMQKKEIE